MHQPSAPASPRHDGTDVLGRRIGAALLDILLLSVVFLGMAALLGDTAAEDGNASARLGPGGTLAFVGITLLYYFLSEAQDGRTLGKRALRVRVVSADGSAAGTGAVAARTLLRLIDSLPILYLLGFLVVLATGRKRQRLGDMAGGTRVVADRR